MFHAPDPITTATRHSLSTLNTCQYCKSTFHFCCTFGRIQLSVKLAANPNLIPGFKFKNAYNVNALKGGFFSSLWRKCIYSLPPFTLCKNSLAATGWDVLNTPSPENKFCLLKRSFLHFCNCSKKKNHDLLDLGEPSQAADNSKILI